MGRSYELRGSAFSFFGLILTTSHVIPAASAITQTMNTTRPISPKTVAMTDLE
jgi:hypothetical protein